MASSSSSSTSTSNSKKVERSQAPPQQVAGNGFQQQRERSFIRDGNRQNSMGSSRGQQQRPQTNNGAAKGSKPNLEIYRPPSLRSETGPPAVANSQTAPTTGNRVQFQAVRGDENGVPRLQKSRTSLDFSTASKASKSVTVVASPVVKTSSDAVHANVSSTSTSTVPAMAPSPLQRSKSMNSQVESNRAPASTAAHLSTATIQTSPAAKTSGDLPDVSQFPEDIQVLLRKVASDPTRASSRSVMEAVKHLFLRVVESSRYAAPVARYCAYVIEKETSETFLESTLNACQEWYQDRDRLLRSPSISSQRWVAFINFLSEIYLKLKRRQHNQSSTSKMKVVNGIVLTPDMILLSLLAECCCVTLKQPSPHSLQELECLFFVLTGIGRDLEQELPAKMAQIMAAIRDAFLESSLPGAAQRTLLQLVELRAAKWQLPATAVKYYYPSISGTAY